MEFNFQNYNKTITTPLTIARSKTFSIHHDKSPIFDSPNKTKRPKTVHIYNARSPLTSISVNEKKRKKASKDVTIDDGKSNDNSSNNSHVDDSEDEPVELTSSTLHSQLKSVLSDPENTINTTVDTSLIKHIDKVDVDFGDTIVHRRSDSSTIHSNDNFQHEDLQYQSHQFPSSPNPGLTYNSTISQEPTYTSQNVVNNDITYNSNAPEPTYTSSNIRSNDLTAYHGSEEELAQAGQDEHIVQPGNESTEHSRKIEASSKIKPNVDLVIKHEPISTTKTNKHKIDYNGFFQPNISDSPSSDTSNPQNIAPSSRPMTNAPKKEVKPSLAELCSKTNRARSRNIVGLSRKTRIDSLHKLSK